jgi:hypothetical protein
LSGFGWVADVAEIVRFWTGRRARCSTRSRVRLRFRWCSRNRKILDGKTRPLPPYAYACGYVADASCSRNREILDRTTRPLLHTLTRAATFPMRAVAEIVRFWTGRRAPCSTRSRVRLRFRWCSRNRKIFDGRTRALLHTLTRAATGSQPGKFNLPGRFLDICLKMAILTR